MKRISVLCLMVLVMVAIMPTSIYAVEKTVVLQPGPGLNNGADQGGINGGKDVGCIPWLATTNYGDETVFHIYNTPCNWGVNPGYLLFSTASLPSDNIVSASIYVYAHVWFNGSGWPWPVGNYELNVHKITGQWNEMDVTFNHRPPYDATITSNTVTFITTTGGGSSGTPFVEYDGWLEFDVTDLYKGWVNGTIPNYGVAVVLEDAFCDNGDELNIYTSDYADNITLRPKLVVTYDESTNSTWYKDADGDKYSDGTSMQSVNRPANYYLSSELTAASGDCNDNDAAIHPGVNEICGDGKDNNCNGTVDEGCATKQTWYKDADSDKYSPGASLQSVNRPANYYLSSELTAISGDCNDNSAAIHPGATEICGDGKDNNCNGTIDEGCVQNIAPPSLLTVRTSSSTQIVLGWKDNSSNETGFKIERKAGNCSSTTTWKQIAAKPANAKTHTVSGLTPNTTYSFRVRAYKGSLNSAYSNCSSAKTGLVGTPPSPTNLRTVSASTTKVNLIWSDNSANETGFKIYRKAGAGAWVLLTKTKANVKTFSDTNAANNLSTTSYQYYVVAFNASGNSIPSIPAAVPYRPANLKAAQGTTATSIKLTWTDKSANETGFEICRKSGDCASTSPWAKVATLGANKTTWTDTGCTAGSTYAYRMRAYTTSGSILSAYGYSLYSVCVSAGDTPITGTEIDLKRGGEATSGDGVTVNVLENSGNGTIEVIFGGHKPSNDPVIDGVAVSDEYTITAKNFETGDTVIPFEITLPVNTLNLPKPFDEDTFAAEWRNEETGKWENVNGMAKYDKGCACVKFLTNHLSEYRVVYYGHDLDHPFLKKIGYYTDSKRFLIRYYESDSGAESSNCIPMTDKNWIGSVTAYNKPGVPHYIEDLGKALETALDYLTTEVITPENAPLFKDPTHGLDLPANAIEFKVTKLPKGTAGDSGCGGPGEVDSQLEDWHIMKVVAAHELIHVLSGQRYWSQGARLNRWYFEAIAELWATRAAEFSREESIAYFRENGQYEQYLKVSLDASDDKSMYSAGDLLYWLEKDVDAPVAAGAVALDRFWDVNGLDEILQDYDTDLGKEYTKYVQESSVGGYDFCGGSGPDQITQRIKFTDTHLSETLTFKQPHLSATFLFLTSTKNVDGLLVAESGRYFGGSDLAVKTYSYIQKETKVSNLEDTLEAKTPANKPLVVKHFGMKGTSGVEYSVFRQVIVNPETGDPNGVGEYKFQYYLLVPPVVNTPTDGKITWKYPNSTAYGDWPEAIKGFYVWLDGVKLTPTPVASQTREYKNAIIKADSKIMVQVVDIFDNEWPEVKAEGNIDEYTITKWELLPGAGQEALEDYNDGGWFVSPNCGTPGGCIFCIYQSRDESVALIGPNMNGCLGCMSCADSKGVMDDSLLPPLEHGDFFKLENNVLTGSNALFMNGKDGHWFVHTWFTVNATFDNGKVKGTLALHLFGFDEQSNNYREESAQFAFEGQLKK